jgi:hypothetical protein
LPTAQGKQTVCHENLSAAREKPLNPCLINKNYFLPDFSQVKNIFLPHLLGREEDCTSREKDKICPKNQSAFLFKRAKMSENGLLI